MKYIINILYDEETKPDFSVELEWTTEQPTQEGQYWVYANNFMGQKVRECVWIDIRDGKLSIDVPVNGYEWDFDFEIKDITHWFGPIYMPEPPKD